MQEEKRDLYHLYEKLESIMIIAAQNQNNARKAIETMEHESSRLRQTSNELRTLFRQEIEKSMSSMTSKGAVNLITKFREADQYAERAAQRYKSVSFWNPIMFFLIVIVSTGVVMSGFTAILSKVIPSYTEINKRFEKMKQLDLLISENDVKLNYCGEQKRRCVKVNKNELEKDLYGDDGEAYVILDGH
jgi:signal transduction histidine kinase